MLFEHCSKIAGQCTVAVDYSTLTRLWLQYEDTNDKCSHWLQRNNQVKKYLGVFTYPMAIIWKFEEGITHRRRMVTEEKAKVVTSVWGRKFVQTNATTFAFAALSILLLRGDLRQELRVSGPANFEICNRISSQKRKSLRNCFSLFKGALTVCFKQMNWARKSRDTVPFNLSQ